MQAQLCEAIKAFQLQKVSQLLADQKCPIDRAAVRYAAVSHFNRSIFEILATFLAEQRQYLLKLARTDLVQSQLRKLGIRHGTRILDSRAAMVVVELMGSASIDYATARQFVPDLVFPSGGTSVYFLVGCNRDAAEILYNAGFKDVDEPDQLMFSPLAALEVPKPSLTDYHGQYKIEDPAEALSSYLAMCAWFHSRGALLNRVFGLAQATPLHHIAGHIGKSLVCLLDAHCKIQDGEEEETFNRRFVNDWTDVLRPLISNSIILQEIFENMEHHDLFSCPCSIGGALPLNILLNETINAYYPINASRFRRPLIVSPLVALVVEPQEPSDLKPRLNSFNRMASVVLRACSFACLDLPHTCRSASLHRYQRLQDDKQTVDDGLNKLVRECEEKFRESGVPLSKFLID
ncbi:hypothetical protein BDW62DRAFT_210102 [Aspergillus aurantiobrunneus]